MKRNMNTKTISCLQSDILWINKLKNDCQKQRVFLALRNGIVDFYHKGGRLFCFTNEFKTHLKYAAVIINKGNGSYLTQSELSNQTLANNFIKNYTRIKENCSKYSGLEADGVAALYHKHSYLSNSNVVVLDIEISFESKDSDKNQDRIDILLLNRETKKLQFVEAKHYSNKELWSTKVPNVIAQINRYQNQVATQKKSILAEYKKYITIMNTLFHGSPNMPLPVPNGIDDKVTLLLFGFDRDQQNGRLDKLIKSNPHYSGVKFYPIGNIKKVVPKNLWNAKTL